MKCGDMETDKVLKNTTLYTIKYQIHMLFGLDIVVCKSGCQICRIVAIVGVNLLPSYTLLHSPLFAK